MSAIVGTYVLVDEDNAPLYVGASQDVAKRVQSHRRSPWWDHVADVWTANSDDMAAAFQRERHLIHALRPKFNKYHTRTIDCPCGCGDVA
jgi:predicted GIY-YIG superfamily endonuclease